MADEFPECLSVYVKAEGIRLGSHGAMDLRVDYDRKKGIFLFFIDENAEPRTQIRTLLTAALHLYDNALIRYTMGLLEKAIYKDEGKELIVRKLVDRYSGSADVISFLTQRLNQARRYNKQS